MTRSSFAAGSPRDPGACARGGSTKSGIRVTVPVGGPPIEPAGAGADAVVLKLARLFFETAEPEGQGRKYEKIQQG